MGIEGLMKVDIRKWEKKIFKSFWLIVFIVFLAELFSYFVHDYKGEIVPGYGFKEIVIFPSVVNIIVVVLSYLIYCKISQKDHYMTQYIIILVPSLFALNASIFHSRVPTIYTALVFPVILSVIYFDKKMTTITLLFNFIAFIVLFILNPHSEIRENMSILLVYLAALGVAFTSSYYIVVRGNELIIKLKSSLESEQELKVRTILMEKISKVEPATGLYNHITFHEYLERLISQSEISFFSIHLSVIDIDNFKKVNDTYGHRIGDKAILAIAEILKKHVSNDDFAVRYGGEEFAVIFTEKDMEQVGSVLEAIRREVEEIHINEMGQQKITVSIGVSQYEKNMAKQTLFDAADKALYIAKREGKNKVVVAENP